MSWWIAIVGGLLLLWLLPKLSGKSKVASAAKDPTADLSSEEKDQLASDIREMANEGYERASKAALTDGKSVQFAHEVGVLDAVYCVLANDNASRRNENVRKNMQMETVPFNRLEPALGKKAVIEYLVWKFLPLHADVRLLHNAFSDFVKIVVENSATEKNPDAAIQRMIFSGRYDWQQLAQVAMNQEKNQNV